ncbi:hypothetical protein [Mesorhizobium sp. M1A.F.Ca.ET.072.01.1.1]|uniref:hypothetical protein n=1 Tax=Mesorhizobium sp. M1A.F.Ca.ET.072.01.1.1 TaxID=2496753 RepID=UPI0016747D9F|nr:hypothetical protein [Mesorhizobium sp. M1A.F.Ca.ET.072.01.1.1]
MTYPPGHEWFCTSPCGAVSITKAGYRWHVWLFGWRLESFANEVQAVMKLQQLTRPTRPRK